MLGGKVTLEYEFIIPEVTKDLFPMSLAGATIQDGGSRERRVAADCHRAPRYKLLISKKRKKKNC